MLLDSSMKAEAIFFGIIEPAKLCKPIIAVVIKTGIRRLVNACGYSLEGFKAAFKHEDAFRQEVFLTVVLIPLAFYLGKSAVEKALMIASVLLVLIVELLNSAIDSISFPGECSPSGKG